MSAHVLTAPACRIAMTNPRIAPICGRGHKAGADHLRPVETRPDRWDILRDLTRCLADFGLRDRDINVLRALLSCLPEAPEHGLVVFASNRSLSERAGGMEERTLRRHLARLVEAGLLARRDSPNRKRYLRRAAGALPSCGFGFDLAPLFAARARIAAAAREATERAAETAALRERLSLLRRALIEARAADGLAEEIRLQMRRIPDAARLSELLTLAKDALMAREDGPDATCGRGHNIEDAPRDAAEMTGSGGQIVRHHHRMDKDLPETRARTEAETLPETAQDAMRTAARPPSFGQVTEACAGTMAFAEERPRSWHDLGRLALMLAPMIGIGGELIARARRAIGDQGFAIAVLCFCELQDRIEKPGAYLRAICRERDPMAAPVRLLAIAAGSARRAAAAC